MLRTYPGLSEAHNIFHSRTCYFPKSRKSELHNILHGIRMHVKFCSFQRIPICVWSVIYIYIVLVQFVNVKVYTLL